MPSEFSSAPSVPLLTIAIPTYNRAANLELLLSGLASQLSGLPQVELIVSDNASPDSTEELMRRLGNEGLRCRYIRNSTNIGSDLNFLQCYREAAGKYVWIFSDDDYIFPGAIARVVRLLEQAEYDIVYLTPSGFIHTPDERGLAAPDAPAIRFDSSGSFVHAVYLRGDLILLSSVIVNKSWIEQHSHPDYETGRSTCLLQMGWVFTALKHFRQGLLIERGLYTCCEENPQRAWDAVRVFGVNWARAARHWLSPGRLLDTILNEQLYGWFTTNWYGFRRRPEHTIIHEPVRQMLPEYGNRLTFWIVAWPILAWPMLPAGGWLALLRIVRRADLALNRFLHKPLRTSRCGNPVSPYRATAEAEVGQHPHCG
jgi:hypothetical protein